MAIQFLNTVAVDTNVLYVDTASDRVGIGTSNPDAKLHIESTAAIGANLILETTHSGGIPLLDLKGAHSGQLRYKDELNIIQGRIDFGDSGTFNFIDVPNNSSTLYLKTGGNVGIGTSNPTTPLEIVSSDNTLLYLNSSTASVYLRLDDANSTNGNFIGATTDDMHFWTNNTERMRIDSSGNVQIGAGTRFGKFDILNVGGSGTNFIVGAGSNGDNYYTSGTSGIQVFRTGSTERMRIDSSGNVGIGVANPSSFFNQARNLVVGGSGNVGATIYSSSSGNTFLAFADVADGVQARYHPELMRPAQPGEEHHVRLAGIFNCDDVEVRACFELRLPVCLLTLSDSLAAGLRSARRRAGEAQAVRMSTRVRVSSSRGEVQTREHYAADPLAR